VDELPGDGDGWCFVHAADLHLDTPFAGLGRVDAELARRLRSASLEAFEALVDLTLARGAALLLLAGDVYDGAERGVRAQLAVHRGLTRLAEAGVTTCIVAGNHDPLDGWSAISSWPDGVTEFGHEAPGTVEVVRDGTLLGVVTGISYEQRAETRNLATMLTRTAAEVPHIGLLHVSVGDHPEHSPYAPCSVEDLRTGGMDYWALGHIHRRQVVLDGSDGGPWAVYPGNLQGRSPKPSERGAKGASVVTVRGGRIVGVEPVSLDRARFDEVVVTVDGDDHLGSVHRRLADAARSAAEAAEGRVLVLRGVVTGRGAVHAELVRDGVVAELLEALDDEAPADPLCAWTGLSVRTEPPSDASEVDGVAGLLAELASVVDDTRAALPGSLGASLDAATAADVGLDLAEEELLEQAAALAIAQLDRGRT
jgi:DNA repair protein SbcD/Mre11